MAIRYQLRPLEAMIQKDAKKEHHRMDPYLVIKIDGKKIKSSVAKKMDAHPTWTDCYFQLPKQPNNTISIELRDKETFGSKTVATCAVDLNEIESKQGVSRWYTLLNKRNEQNGQIFLVCDLVDNGMLLPRPVVSPTLQQSQVGSATRPEIPVTESVVRVQETNIARTNTQESPVKHAPVVVEQRVEKVEIPVIQTNVNAGFQPNEEVLTPHYISEGNYRVPSFYAPATERDASKGKLVSAGFNTIVDEPGRQVTHVHEEYQVEQVPVHHIHHEEEPVRQEAEQKVIVDKFVEVRITEEQNLNRGEGEGVLYPQPTEQKPDENVFVLTTI